LLPYLAKRKAILFQKENSFESVLLQKPLLKEKEFFPTSFQTCFTNFGCVKCFQLIFELVSPKPSIVKAKWFQKKFQLGLRKFQELSCEKVFLPKTNL
jgi:hypothetical protein